MLRLLAFALALGAALAAKPAQTAVVTLPVQGVVEAVGPGTTGIAAGNTLSGTVMFDQDDDGCPSSCLVTDFELRLPGGSLLGPDDLVGPATVDVLTFPGSFDALADITGAPYGVAGGILFAGQLSSAGPGTFEIFGDPAGTTLVASGALTITPLPAALPLLGTTLVFVVGFAWKRRPR
jgi:hypothetical protein